MKMRKRLGYRGLVSLNSSHTSAKRSSPVNQNQPYGVHSVDNPVSFLPRIRALEHPVIILFNFYLSFL